MRNKYLKFRSNRFCKKNAIYIRYCLVILLFNLLSTSALCQQNHIGDILNSITIDFIEENPNKVERILHSLLKKYPNRTFEQDSILAEALHNLAKEYYYYDQYSKCIELTNLSLLIKEKIYPKEHFSRARSLYNLAVFYKELGRYRKALKLVENRQRILIQYYPDSILYIGKGYQELADLNDGLSDFKLAIENYDLALSIFEKTDKEDVIYDIKINKAISLYKYGKTEESIKFSKKILDSLPYIYEKTHLTSIYTNLANLYAQSNKQKSITYLKKAIETNKKFGEYYTQINIAIYNNLAVDRIKLGLFNAAKKDIDIALSISKKVYEDAPYFYQYASMYENYADIYLSQKKYRNAIENFHLAILNSTSNFRDSSIYANPDFSQHIIVGPKTDLLTYLPSKARGFKAWFDATNNKKYLKEALKILHITDKLIDDIRFEHQEEKSKLYWRKVVYPIYVQAIEIAYLLGDNEAAFHFCEKSKAILLLDEIRDTQAKELANLPDSIEMFIKSNQGKIYEKEKSLAYEDDIELRKEILELKQKLRHYINELEQQYPNYFKYKYDTKILSINAVQKKLEKQQILMEYFIADSVLYCFTISNENFNIHKLTIDTTFREHLQSLRTAISDLSYVLNNPEESITNYTKNARYLYEKIIPENVKQLISNSPKELLIIPDGLLNYIPFEALLTKELKTNQRNFQAFPYLLFSANISYAYSINTLYQIKNQQNPTNIYLGIAPSYENANELQNSSTHSDTLTMQHKLGTLKANKIEVKGVGKILGGDTWIGEQAIESSFKKNAFAYQILHLAMHAVVNIEDPMQSKMIFTQEDDNQNDSYLNVYELNQLKLQAELIALSACSTGDGKLIQGEGVMSLARAFIRSGCSSTIMSMWKAEDQATSTLMQLFFKELYEGKKKNIALQNAKKQYISQKSSLDAHPVFWSNFVLIGNTSPIEFISKGFSTIQIVFLLFSILLVLILAYFLYKKRNKKS